MAGFWGGLRKGLSIGLPIAASIPGPHQAAVAGATAIFGPMLADRERSFADEWAKIAGKLIADEALDDDERERKMTDRIVQDLEIMGKTPKRFRVRYLVSQAFMTAFGDFDQDDDD